MFVCLIAMSLPLWNAPAPISELGELPATRASVSTAIGSQQQFFGPDDPTPEVRLRPKFRAKTDSESTESEDADVSEALAVILESEEKEQAEESGSFFATMWPYVLILVAMLAWGVSKLFFKRPASFGHPSIAKRQKGGTGSGLKGQFKASERFKREDKSEVEKEIV